MKTVVSNVGILVAMFLLYLLPSVSLGLLLLLATEHQGEVFVWLRDLTPLLAMLLTTVTLCYWARQLGLWDKHQWRLTASTWVNLLGLFVLSRLVIGGLDYLQPEMTGNDSSILRLFDLYPVWLLAIFICVVAPICEEVIFRGMLIGRLFAKHMGWGVAVSTVVFAAIHVPSNAIEWLMYGSLGLAFSCLYWRSRQLWPCIVMHMLNNVLAMAGLLGWLN